MKGREPYSSEKESSEKGEGAFGGGDGGGNLEQESLIGQNESQPIISTANGFLLLRGEGVKGEGGLLLREIPKSFDFCMY